MRGCYPAQIHVVSKSGAGKLIKYHQFVRHAWRPQNVAPSTPTKTVGDRPCIHDVPATATAPKPNCPRAAAPRWPKMVNQAGTRAPLTQPITTLKSPTQRVAFAPTEHLSTFFNLKTREARIH